MEKEGRVTEGAVCQPTAAADLVRVGILIVVRVSLIAALLRSRVFWWGPVNPSHDTLGCQFMNVPFGLSFHAQTWSV